nr:MAG TPA: hypothetical protein [Microviridae sp.]
MCQLLYIYQVSVADFGINRKKGGEQSALIVT